MIFPRLIRMHLSRLAPFLGALLVGTLAGCASQPKLQLPTPLPVPPRDSSQTAQQPSGEAAPQVDTERALQRSPTPRPILPDTSIVNLSSDERLPPLPSQPVSVNVDSLPIAVFANLVFSEMLGLNLSVDPAISKLQELVTLHTNEAQKPLELFSLARQVLAEYGVQTSVEGNLVQLRLSPDDTSVTPPLIISGRALPQVPVTHRPIFQLFELEVVRSGDAVRWLTTLFGKGLNVREDAGRNAVLVSGKPVEVRQAIEALRVFDRPLMRGRISTRLEPAFMTADQLADRLVEVLNVQGYGASRSLGSSASILVVPIPTVNSVLVFASSQDVMEYAVSWAKELDRPNAAGGTASIFYYQVKNTKAAELAQVLSGSMNISNRESAAAASAAQSSSTVPGESAPRATVSAGGGGMASGLLVDEPRNALIYQGDPTQWERLSTLIRQMDRAPRQVMIEVTIAEVTLEKGDQFGVAWLAKNGFGRFNGTATFGSMPSSGGNDQTSGGNGLTYLLDVAGQNRFALTAFANDSRVNILSVPRLLVKSGNEANIDIGTEVPTISMTTTSNQTTDGNTNLLQSIQYRKTGIILRIKPTVYSDDRIDLDISQEVSEAMPVPDDSKIGSPSIFNRALNSSLSLRDGGSVVMAGLMSERNTDGSNGIPVLKDVPVLGNLFKSRNRSSNKTELVLMIVPYIIESDERASAVSQAIVDRLQLLELSPDPAAAVPPAGAQPSSAANAAGQRPPAPSPAPSPVGPASIPARPGASVPRPQTPPAPVSTGGPP